ncbi:hypothetical protein PHET_11174 [Paragonimus heterotremus]|uniref:Uncharacterized protein n=1 Tax=Paragonimus heterotremus TaxID=100268 RepID=A0A8J4T0U8_9TREM|nr:hypothetical protein PHET_11174 [Paragonimus heterotremus]
MFLITVLKFVLPFLIQGVAGASGQARIKENSVALRQTVYGRAQYMKNLVDGSNWMVPFPGPSENRAAYFVDLGAVYELSSIQLHGHDDQFEGEFEQCLPTS